MTWSRHRLLVEMSHSNHLDPGAFFALRRLSIITMNKFYYLLLISIAVIGLSYKHEELLTPSIEDDQVLRLVYSSYKYPQGFYQEELTHSSIYYENTISIMPMQQRVMQWNELCTDDHDQARAWSDSSGAHSEEEI
jgi:hypothetical protein